MASFCYHQKFAALNHTFTKHYYHRAQVGGAASRDRASQAFKQLQEESPEVLKASFRQLRDKSLKTRAGVLLTLKELISVVPKCLSHDVEQLLPGLTAALNVSLPFLLRAPPD